MRMRRIVITKLKAPNLTGFDCMLRELETGRILFSPLVSWDSLLVGHYGGKALYFTVSVIAMYIEHNHLNALIKVMPHFPDGEDGGDFMKF